MPEPLHVPELPAGVDTLTAALRYAAAGWYVGHTKRGSKSPADMGAGWPDRTSRDPEVITSWFAGTDYGVFLHCGRSGAVVVDVDHPDRLPEVLLDAIRERPTVMQTTRVGDEDRGHYLYAMPAGRLLGNAVGKLGGQWGDIRGSNGVVIAAPSVHKHAADGGLYAWQSTGVLAALPESIAVLLGDAETSTAPATLERLRIFADTYTADLDRRPLAAWCNRFEKLTAGGASRHETMKDLLPGAFEEVLAGLYPARLACERLTAVFTAATVKPGAGELQGTARTEREAVAEWLSMARWALARAETSDPTTVLTRVGKVFPDLAAPSAPGEAEGSGPVATATTAGKASVSTQLVELAAASYRFGQSSKHEPFAVPLGGSNVARMLRGAGGSLRAELAAAYFAEHRKIAPQQALTDAVLTLEGMAQQAEPEVLHLRSAVAGESVWLDLGGTTGSAVQITGHGWRIQESAPVLFHRTALTAALPEPESGGTLAELWAMLNVAPEDHPLVLGWLLAALLTPDLPCPVLALTGEQGTGKTTATKRAAALVDPTHPQVRRSPKDGEAWVSAATGSRVVALDNVSAIPEWFSDALCRAVTGDGDVRRRLYSDGDYHVIAFRRAVVVNGIDLGAVRDDLAERLLTVQLDRITEDHRGRESDLVLQLHLR